MELPDAVGRAELVRRYAHFLQHFSAELGQRPLVLTNGDFFPDVFNKDAGSVTRLVRRLQAHAGMGDIPIDVAVVQAEGPGSLAGACGTGSCGTGSCGAGGSSAGAADPASDFRRLVETDSGWELNVRDGELHHPVALTCNLARSLAMIFLAETSDSTAQVEPPVEVSIDLACVALGFGTLVLEGSYVYAKSCGGPSVTQLTALSAGELAVACALFIEAGGHSGRRALKELGTTQRALLSEANAWAASNADVVRLLAIAPADVPSHLGELRESRAWLARLLGGKKSRSATPSLEVALAGGLSDTELLRLSGQSSRTAEAKPRRKSDPKRDEIKALVDEALGSSS